MLVGVHYRKAWWWRVPYRKAWLVGVPYRKGWWGRGTLPESPVGEGDLTGKWGGGWGPYRKLSGAKGWRWRGDLTGKSGGGGGTLPESLVGKGTLPESMAEEGDLTGKPGW